MLWRKTTMIGALLVPLAAQGAAHKAHASLTNGAYVVTIENGNLCVGESTTGQGAKLIQTTCDGGGADQTWTLTNDPGGYVHLTNTASGNVWDVTGYSKSNGALMDTWPYGGSSHLNQEFLPIINSDGSYNLKVELSGLCVDQTSGSTKVGQQFEQWTCGQGKTNQSFKFVAQGNNQVVNGQCGSANGQSSSTAPSNNLCASGNASVVLASNGMWVWSCSGLNGGSSANCAAPDTAGGGGSTSLPTGWPTTFAWGTGMWQESSQFTYLENGGFTKNGTAALGLWDRYLSGGITSSGANNGWQSWGGASFIASDISHVQTDGMVPIFTYYMLVGTYGYNDGQQPTAVNNASAMAAYWADFTALMKAIKAATSSPVYVHVEPDLWGYAEPNGLGASAQTAGSGNSDLAGIPNTMAGLGQAYLHLRDLYAPNVILSANVSPWSWNTTNCGTNVSTVADTDAAFMGGLGSSSEHFDLYFTDISFGDHGQGQGVYFDPNNSTCPNFTRLNTYAAEFTSKVGKKLVLWQTPLGNSYDNNAAWHYTDTIQQYLLSGYPGDGHLSALANSGVIGVIFPGGEPSPTDLYDAAGDSTGGCSTTFDSRSDDDCGLLHHNLSNNYNPSPLTLH